MRISILTYGTRGDVQPFMALAVGLRDAGHHVCFAAPETFGDFVSQHGLEFVGLPGDPAQLSQGLVQAGMNPFQTWRMMFDYGMQTGARLLQVAYQACEGSQAILSSFLLFTGAHALAQRFGVPHFYCNTFPVFTRTASFPNLIFPDIGSETYNRWTHDLFAGLFWQTNRIGYNIVRRRVPELSLDIRDPLGDPSLTILNAFSPLVVPPPSDWGDRVYVVGYWFLESASTWTPSNELIRFLESGLPPVCITLGSMITRDAAALTRMMIDALAQANQRGILIGGWGGLGNIHLPDSIFYVDSIPHDWLFSRVAAVVHHGGAGTTAAVLRAGVPSILIPLTADQPFWGRRVKALGVGDFIARKKLNAEALARGITLAVNDSAMRQTAASLAARIRSENGIANAIEIIERNAA